MSATDGFVTGVAHSSGLWPAQPEWMSYSSLRELEECPRRWALRRASYPEIWDRSGYPDYPAVPTLVGDVVHLALEHILRALVDQRCDSPRSACAVGVLRALGGYTSIVEAAIDSTLSRLEVNPRVRYRLPSYRTALGMKLPELRRRVQEIVSRSALSLREDRGNAGDAGSHAGALAIGSHAEVELRVQALGWLGRVDLISLTPTSCEIVDYKTGKEQGSHAEQLRTYALLWSRDSVLNPTARPATKLVIAYPTNDRPVDVPDATSLNAMEASIRVRTDAAREELRGRPPRAHPARETCSNCSVRHLCAEYWQDLATRTELAEERIESPTFGDVELHVETRNGPKSWDVVVTRGITSAAKVKARVLASDESTSLLPGSRVRLLNVLIHREEEGQNLLLTIAASTETFQLATFG